MIRLKTSSMTPVIAVCVSDSFGHELPVRIDDRPNQIVPTFEITPAGIRSYFQPTMAAPYSSTLNFGFNAGTPGAGMAFNAVCAPVQVSARRFAP